MSEWIAVAALSEIPLGTMKAFDLSADRVTVAHTAEGLFAVSDTCSHAEVSLAEGELNGCAIECWMHGATFDLRTGEPQSPPAVTPIATYQVRTTGDPADPQIEVQIGGEK